MGLLRIAAAIVGGLILSGLAYAIILWLVARWRQFPRRSFGRASLIVFVMAMLQVAILLVVSRFDITHRLPELAGFAIVLMIASLVVNFLVIKSLSGATLGGALLALMAMTFVGGAVSLGIAQGAKRLITEAFVIPTGSMATTLMGRRLEAECENCGAPCQIGDSEIEDGIAAHTMVSWRCEYCGHKNAGDDDAPRAHGDRILIDKLATPERWGLAVFEFQTEPLVNFVDRVVGLPGETLDIREGEIFIDGKRLQKKPGVAESLWTTIHDTAYAPQEIGAESRRWAPAEKGWSADGPPWKCAAGDAWSRLRFEGPIDDRSTYNSAERENRSHDLSTQWAGDLQIDCRLADFASGELTIACEFGGYLAQATVTADGAVVVSTADTASEAGPTSKSGQLRAPLSAGGRIVLSVRDGRVYCGDGQQVVVRERLLPPEVAIKPTGPAELKIVAHNCAATIARIIVRRDVYYQSFDQLMGGENFASKFPHAELPIKLGDDEFFVLGDNSALSKDSRFSGAVKRSAIKGVARLIYWPPERWGRL